MSAVQPHKLDGETLVSSVPGLPVVAVRPPVIYGRRPSKLLAALRADAAARGFAPTSEAERTASRPSTSTIWRTCARLS
jgi:nucleoside-diphosphate-sugar epimerase